MAKWYEKLYIGNGSSEIADEVIKSIDEGGIIPPDAYLITLSNKPGDQMEIFKASLLYFPYHRNNVNPIIGIAKGESEGYIVMLNILSDVYRETGDLNAKEFFKNRI